ncbi:MAG: LCP family protein, partial [Lachnospiraceae bacterium]|nr:LCP family protein [Lachnospiraceae bacterium]
MKEEQEMNNLSDNLTKEIDELFDEEASKTMDEAVDAVIQASETDDDMIFEVADELADDDDYIDPADLFDSVTEKDIEKHKENAEKPAEVPADDDEAWSVDDVPKKKSKGKSKNKKAPVEEKKEKEVKPAETKPQEEPKSKEETKAQEEPKAKEEPEAPEKSAAPEKTEEVKETSDKDSDDDFVPVLDLSDVDMEYKEPENEEKASENAEESDDNAGDDMFDDINLALSEQVEKQLGPSFAELLEEEENASARLKEKSESKDGNEEDDEDKKGVWALIPLWLKVLLGILLFLVLFGLFLLFTKPGHVIVSKIAAKFVTSQVGNIENPNEVQHIGEENLSGDISVLNTPTPDPDETKTPDQEPTPTPLPTVAIVDNPFEEDTSVINILLIGEENYYHEFRGRSDAMMVASLDKDGGDLKLVSFMRDMYVEIPGYSDNKLNAAYAIGGAPLLVQTLEKNFGVKCDGYVLIQYDGFETIVDS